MLIDLGHVPQDAHRNYENDKRKGKVAAHERTVRVAASAVAATQHRTSP
jgi:hypothetical protein